MPALVAPTADGPDARVSQIDVVWTELVVTVLLAPLFHICQGIAVGY